MAWMEQFLSRLRELLQAKVKDGDITADEFDTAVRQARSHVGGLARGEKYRAEKESGQPKEEGEAKQMPYDRLEQLPAGVRGALPEDAQKVWLAAFNSAAKQHPGDDGAAASIAWGAVKHAGYHPADGGWKKGGEADIPLERIIAAAEATRMGTYNLLGAVALAEGGKSIEVQIFPRIGTYQHPRYGKLEITPDFLREVKQNFDGRIYQQELPLTIDLEHQSSLSGAVGWVSKVENRGADGLFATIDLNDRGQELVGKDAYRYFSPEYYDKWTDPASGKDYANVLIGGALTNRPFFKGMRPVAVMSEGALAFAEPAEEAAEPPTKTEDGQAYPADAYLYVPDPQMPSTWKLRVWESPTAKVTRAQLGRAAAALGGGFRGEKVEMPAADKAKCIAKLRGLYSQMGMKPDEMPAQVRASLADAGLDEAAASAVLAEIGLAEKEQNVGMTEEEAKRLTELETAHKTLTERLAAEETARKAAEAEAKAASERAARLERDANRKTLAEEVRTNRLGYRGEIDAAVTRLESLQAKLSPEEFAGILEDHRAVHAQMAESDLLKQTSRRGAEAGVGGQLEGAVAKLMSEKGLSRADATIQAVRDNPRLYAQVDAEHNRRAKRGDD